MKDILSQFEKDGFAVVPDFLEPGEVEELRRAGLALTENLPAEGQRCVFNTIDNQQSRDQYFLDSAHKISHFFEAEALDEHGKLRVAPEISLNKVGHALHWLHPVFRKHTFSDKVKDAALQLELLEPAVVQSMYIYKNPGVGSDVSTHQDATYLFTDPVRLCGFWLALEDARRENGCLWIAPGSHTSGVHRRYRRNPDPSSPELLIYDRPESHYQLSSFRPVEVKRGSCVLLHGQVVHFSRPNRSERSRHAYTFHIVETKHAHYSKRNWIQPQQQPEGHFPMLYTN